MSVSVTGVAVSSSNPVRTNAVLRDWASRYCQGAIASALNDLLFPMAGAGTHLSVKFGNNNGHTFNPLPFAHDNVVLVGRQSGNNLTVVFFDLASGRYLPALVTLPYAERLKFVGRGRRQFVAELVTEAKKQNVPVSA